MNKKPRQTHLNERILHVPFEIYEARTAICKECYAYQADGGVCKIVNSAIASKTLAKAGSCPMGFWSSHYGS